MANRPDPERIRLMQDALIGRLVPDLVHQLRNPLNSILTSAELLAQSGDHAELRDKLLPVLSRSAQRLRDVLGFSDALPGPSPNRVFELREALADALVLLQCRRHTVVVHNAEPGPALPIRGEWELVWTLILCLLEESLRCTDNELWIRISETSDAVEVEFAGDGNAAAGREQRSRIVRDFTFELASYLGATVYYDGDSESERRIEFSLPKLVSNSH